MEVYCPNCGSDDCRFITRFSTYKCAECGCEFDDELMDFDNEDPAEFSDDWEDDFEKDYVDFYDE